METLNSLSDDLVYTICTPLPVLQFHWPIVENDTVSIMEARSKKIFEKVCNTWLFIGLLLLICVNMKLQTNSEGLAVGR